MTFCKEQIHQNIEWWAFWKEAVQSLKNINNISLGQPTGIGYINTQLIVQTEAIEPQSLGGKIKGLKISFSNTRQLAFY